MMRVEGLFTLQDTYGFPLSDSLNECLKNGLTPNWENYIGEALLHNWTDEKISEYIKLGFADSNYPEVTINILEFVQFTIKKNWNTDLKTTAKYLIEKD